MDRDLVGKRPTFHRGKPQSNSYRILVLLSMILAAVWMLIRVDQGAIRPLFEPTPTPTRVARSYVQEAEAYFEAGRIDDPNSENDAIDTYRLALKEDPQDAMAWTALARVLTYSSNLMSTQEQSRLRMLEARQAIDQALALDPDASIVHATRAFVLDWASAYEDEDEAQRLLTEAYDEATRAIQLDANNGLTLAFFAEVLLDQQRWSQAKQYADQAVELAPDQMDAWRVRGTVLESLGLYSAAIDDYEEAVKITPNLTFLYIQIGVNYRYLALQSNNTILFEEALSYFDRAVSINEQLGVKHPLPYIAIAKTYSQMGEFFSAALNAEKALSLSPADANSYGQLGIIYFKAKNYESSVPALKCAVLGCSAEENMVLQTLSQTHPDWEVKPVAVEKLPLESVEIAYYYAEYGQVLAFLSRPKLNFCDQALPVLDQVRVSYSHEPVLMDIVESSESYCQRLGGTP